MNERYARQMLLSEIGESGQVRLAKAKVLVVGVGGLGSPLTMALVGAGVGTIGLVDYDVVSLSNLHRQLLYFEEEIGKSKVDCAAKRLKNMNSEVTINTYNIMFDSSNARGIIANYDMVVDACDNFNTRYLLDELCAEFNIPYIYGAIRGFEGQVSVFDYRYANNEIIQTYRTLYPTELTDDVLGDPSLKAVVSMSAGIIANVQAAEVLKLICNFGKSLIGILWTYNILTNESCCYKLT